jgi:hypothetical protein
MPTCFQISVNQFANLNTEKGIHLDRTRHKIGFAPKFYVLLDTKLVGQSNNSHHPLFLCRLRNSCIQYISTHKIA